jgi:hypothetical protein
MTRLESYFQFHYTATARYARQSPPQGVFVGVGVAVSVGVGVTVAVAVGVAVAVAV